MSDAHQRGLLSFVSADRHDYNRHRTCTWLNGIVMLIVFGQIAMVRETLTQDLHNQGM